MSMIKLKKIKLSNFKNVSNGIITTNVDFDSLTEGSVIGVYGQNGSGKTAFVEALKILDNLLKKKKLPAKNRFLIMDNRESAELEYEFIMENSYGQYYIMYSVLLEYKEDNEGEEIRLIPIREELKYKENEYNKRYKRLVYKNNNEVYIMNVNIEELNEDNRVDLKVRCNVTLNESYSFIFDKEAREIFHSIINEEEIEILKFLVYDFSKDLHVIDSVHNGLVLGNIVMPLSINIQNLRGHISYNLTDISVMPLKVFETVKNTIEQINIVLDTIIPNLKIEAKKIHNETTDLGEDGVRVEFLTHKTKEPLPIRCESAGALKIISILSSLIAVYNKPNSCVIIDELDAGIFEFLLGEILEVIENNCRGQLFFTSHNLRILEVLNHKNLWFTTSNENNRYIQLKGIKELSNPRDIYLRAVQLGGQKEDIYQSTKAFKMKRAFNKAGDSYGK